MCISTISALRELNVGELNFVLGSKIKVAGKFQYRAKTNFTDCLLCKKCTLCEV